MAEEKGSDKGRAWASILGELPFLASCHTYAEVLPADDLLHVL